MNEVTETKRHEVIVDEAIAKAYETVFEAERDVRRYLESIARLANRSLRTFNMNDVNDARQRFAAGEIGSSNSWNKGVEGEYFVKFDKAVAILKDCDANYREECKNYKGWSRFFLVHGGHIHSSMDCSTCNNGLTPTQFGWLPQLSGLNEVDAVAEQGAILCTVCFPMAPVEYTNKYDLEAEAKAAARCAGSGTRAVWVEQTDARRGHWSHTCPVCGEWATLTPSNNYRAHSTPVKAGA